VAYAYDQRLTCGEGSVESAWTISKLSASLHWLEGFHSCTDWQVNRQGFFSLSLSMMMMDVLYSLEFWSSIFVARGGGIRCAPILFLQFVVHLLVFFFIVVAIFVFFISPLSLLFISRFNTSPMLHVPGHCRSLPLVFDPAHSVLPVLARPYGCFALLSRCVHHRAIREALRAAVLVTCAGYAGDGERPPGLLPSQQGVHKFWQEKLDLPNKGAPGGRRRRRGGATSILYQFLTFPMCW